MDIRIIGPEIGAAASAAPKLAKLKKAASDVEAIFLKDLIHAMRRSLSKSAWGSSPGTEVYQDMFEQALAESAAKQGSFGFARMLVKQLAPAVMREANARTETTSLANPFSPRREGQVAQATTASPRNNP